MYEERPSRVPGAVLWWNPAPTGGRVLPDGCMDLLWLDEQLVVAGPDTRAFVSRPERASVVAGVRFAPGTAPAVLGVPAQALRDQRVPLEDLWPRADVRRLTDEVGGAPDPTSALERVAGRAWRDAPAPDPEVAAVVRALAAGRDVAAVADGVGRSPRQLHRHSLAWFGYGPKTLARVLRLQTALALVRAAVPPAVAAADAGYADQAHLARDTRALAGTSLTALLAGS